MSLFPPWFRVTLVTLALAVTGCTSGAAVVGGLGDGGGMDAAIDVSCTTGQNACGGRCVDNLSLIHI